MSSSDYLIAARGIIERGIIYNYLHELGYEEFVYTREYMINSDYPFAVCIKRKEFIIIESATLCYLNDREGRVIDFEKFREFAEKQKRKEV